MSGIYWRTKEGKHLLPRRMGDSHIINTIKMIAEKTNNPLCTFSDWQQLEREFPIMQHLLYEAFVRELTQSFHESFISWAWGIDDADDDQGF